MVSHVTAFRGALYRVLPVNTCGHPRFCSRRVARASVLGAACDSRARWESAFGEVEYSPNVHTVISRTQLSALRSFATDRHPEDDAVASLGRDNCLPPRVLEVNVALVGISHRWLGKWDVAIEQGVIGLKPKAFRDPGRDQCV